MSLPTKRTSRGTENPCCTWCGKGHVRLTADHIFPRSIGGTKELSVPACDECQNSLSLAEQEFARASPYAICIAENGPRGRDKRKPNSGVIRTRYLLVRHPLGGYGETALRAGAGIGEALPHIEINVNGPTEARVRGGSRKDVDRLVEAASALLSRSPDSYGLVCEISVRADELGEIGNDSDFWPRIVLDLDKKLFIRARDPVEAQRFVSIFARALKAGAFEDQGRWTSSEVTAGTVHTTQIAYNHHRIQRVIAKIALGLVYLRVGPGRLWDTVFRDMRAAIVDDQPTARMPAVRQVSEPGNINFWPDHHIGSVQLLKGRLRGIVSVYGDCQIIDLGSWPKEDGFEGIVAFCKTKGGRLFSLKASSTPHSLRF